MHICCSAAISRWIKFCVVTCCRCCCCCCYIVDIGYLEFSLHAHHCAQKKYFSMHCSDAQQHRYAVIGTPTVTLWLASVPFSDICCCCCCCYCWWQWQSSTVYVVTYTRRERNIYKPCVPIVRYTCIAYSRCWNHSPCVRSDREKKDYKLLRRQQTNEWQTTDSVYLYTAVPVN